MHTKLSVLSGNGWVRRARARAEADQDDNDRLGLVFDSIDDGTLDDERSPRAP